QIDESEIIEKYKDKTIDSILKNGFCNSRIFFLRYLASLFRSYYASHRIKCITNSRLTPMPHQINVAHRLTEEFFPRKILADEVGLGKTIEAGIYIKEMIARGLAERILIIVPATLLKQWQFEMENKFNLRFTIFDGKKIKELRKNKKLAFFQNFINPFYHSNYIICSLQFARNPEYAELLSQINWDIVVFDEAHHLRRYARDSKTRSYRETLNYKLAKKISQNCESLLLLTATPLQLYSFDLFSLLELIRPEIFNNYSDFEHFRKNIPFINLLLRNLNSLKDLNTFELKNTIRLLKELKYIPKNEDFEKILKKLENNSFKNEIIKKIEKDHTFAPHIIRNRKKNVFLEEFLNKRIVRTIVVEPKSEELEIYNEIRLYLAKIYNENLNKKGAGLGFVITTLQKMLTSSKFAILKSIERRLEQIQKLKNKENLLDWLKEEDPEFFESEMENITIENTSIKSNQKNSEDLFKQEKILKEFCEKLKNLPFDSKVEKLIKLIKQITSGHQSEKILIFTQFLDTLFYLKSILEEKIKVAMIQVFHGRMTKEQKDEAVEKFRTYKGISILISTEIGGEGRNFQFCRILINYDLPWNPMKLEQRIGRLDRIGQESKEIYIYNFFIENTIETDIIFALNKRINLFEESLGVLEPIIGKIEKEMQSIIFSESSGKKRKRLNDFYRMLDLQIKKAKELEMQLDDMLLDKKSFQSTAWLDTLSSEADLKISHDELFILVKEFFENTQNIHGSFNIINNGDKNAQYIEVKIEINQTSPLMQNKNKLTKSTFIGTFDLDLARIKENLEFFALGHPLIDNIIHYINSDAIKEKIAIIRINKEEIKELFGTNNIFEQPLYIFIFEVQFQAFISEKKIFLLILDNKGRYVKELKTIFNNQKNLKKLIEYSKKTATYNLEDEKIIVDKDKMRMYYDYAKKNIKNESESWLIEIRKLNDKIFRQEMMKKRKIFEYKEKILTEKLKTLKVRYDRLIKNRPTERKLKNIEKIEDEIEKNRKLNQIKQLEENIKMLERDIKKLEIKIDDLKFAQKDLENDYKKRNKEKILYNLIEIGFLLTY
ncbi:MAG: SNF2-related protein, partial [Promethearchaeia archaeon]